VVQLLCFGEQKQGNFVVCKGGYGRRWAAASCGWARWLMVSQGAGPRPEASVVQGKLAQGWFPFG